MENKVRVLHVNGILNRGGAESRLMDIYKHIDREKIQFDFAHHTSATSHFSKDIKSLGGQIYVLPRFNLKNFFKYIQAWSFLLKENEYDVIHGHMTSTAFIYLYIAKKLNVKTRIAHARSSNKSSYLKYFTAKLARFFATDMFAVSQLAGISEFGKWNVKKGNVRILPNAIEAQRYIFNVEKRDEMRLSLGVEGKCVVGHIGRFSYPKNHIFLLDVFKRFLEVQTNAILFLVGQGELLDNVKQRVVDLDLGENVVFLGVRDDIPDLIQSFDILLFPSVFEGLPGVVLECQVSGLPCLISDSITREVQITQNVVFYSLKKTPEEWAVKMEKMVKESDRKNYYDDFVKKGFDIKAVSEWYQEFYLTL